MVYPESELPDLGVLLVEGQDDKHVVWHLCDQESSVFFAERSGHCMNVTVPSQSSTFRISDKDSRSELINSISSVVKGREYKAVGIMLDADDSPGERWDQVTWELAKAGLTLPESPNPAGTIVPAQDGFHPRVGIWMMPDNQRDGELEDFVLRMIRCDDRVWPLSQEYVDNIPERDRKFSTVKSDKAKLYAWLAARKDPGRMGASIGQGDIEVGGPLCTSFTKWLVDLFG